MTREKCEGEAPPRVKVPMRGTGAEQPVVAMRVRNGTGAKGPHRPAVSKGQPGKREEPRGKARSSDGGWSLRAG